MKFRDLFNEMPLRKRGEFEWDIFKYDISKMKVLNLKFDNFKIYYNDLYYLLTIDDEIIYEFHILVIRKNNNRFLNIIRSNFNKNNTKNITRGNKITERFYELLLNNGYKLLSDWKQSDPSIKIWYNLSRKFKVYLYNDFSEIKDFKYCDNRFYSLNDKDYKDIKIILTKDEL